MELLFTVVIISILAAITIPRLLGKKILVSVINGSEGTKMYVLENELGFSYIQFQDKPPYKTLDRVLHFINASSTDLSTIVPRSEDISDPNSPDWDFWLKKWEERSSWKVLER